MKILLVIIAIIGGAIVWDGCFNADWDNNNYPEFASNADKDGNGCSLEEWMAFYDENKTYINMSRETWLDKYPGK